MRYYYRVKNHINFEANEEEYNKYIKDSDIFYVYKPKCQISYHSDNGKLTADFTGKKISFEPGTFNSAELRSITKLVYQKSRSKIFSTDYTRNHPLKFSKSGKIIWITLHLPSATWIWSSTALWSSAVISHLISGSQTYYICLKKSMNTLFSRWRKISFCSATMDNIRQPSEPLFIIFNHF